MSGPTGKEDHPGQPNANTLPWGDSAMAGSEQHGPNDIVVFRDLEIELTGWPSGDGIGFRSRVAGEAPDGSRMQVRDSVPAVFDPGRFWGEPDFGIPGVLEKLASDPAGLSDDEIMALGADLADLAIPAAKGTDAAKSVREIFNSSYRAVAREHHGLRIRLRIEVEELKELPWEFMHIQGEGRGNFVALNRDISIVRTDVTEVRDYRPRSRGAVRLSLVLAGLTGANQLKVEKDYEAVTAAVDSINEDLDGPGVQFAGAVDPNRPVDTDGVRRLLGDSTDIFYFAGHGEIREIDGKQETVLLLGEDEFLPARGFAGLLAGAAPRLAMLGACDSARRDPRNPWNGMAAELVKRAVPAVIGHQFPILSIAARDFAATVFLYVLQRRSIDEAVAQARLNLRTRPGADWGIPALYLDNGDGVLFPGERGAFGETQEAIATIDRAVIEKRARAYSPFRGVNYYQREHRPFFFGRGTTDLRCVEALDSGVAAVTVHGPPGCGKTSFLLAGVAGLREGTVIRLDDYSKPVESLREKLLAGGVTAPRCDTWRDLTAAAPRLVLVLDQFERVFEQKRDEALEQLELLVAEKPNHVDILIGIRTDAYGRFDDVRRAMDLADHAVRLDLLTRSEAREVLVGAFQAVPPGIAFAPGLVDDIVRDLDLLQSTGTDAIDPTQLQIVAESVFKAVRERSVDPRQELVVARADYLGAVRIVAGYLRQELVNRFPNADAAKAVLSAIAASREDGWVRRSGLNTELAEETMDETLRRLARTGFLVAGPPRKKWSTSSPVLQCAGSSPTGSRRRAPAPGGETPPSRARRRLERRQGRSLRPGSCPAGAACSRPRAQPRRSCAAAPLRRGHPPRRLQLARSRCRGRHRSVAGRHGRRRIRAGTRHRPRPLRSRRRNTCCRRWLRCDRRSGGRRRQRGEPQYGGACHRPSSRLRTRLDIAIADVATGWRPAGARRAVGTVTDADPSKVPLSAPRSLRAMAWSVKVARRIRHDRHVIVRRADLAGIGAGLLLGLQRAAVTQFTRRTADPETEWAVQLVFAFVWGFALVASLVAAGEAARSGLRRTEQAAPAKVVAAGSIAFAIAMLLVGLANGLSRPPVR